MSHYFRRAILGFLLAIVLECAVFNLDYFLMIFDKNTPEIVLTLESFEMVNWDESDDGYVSRYDPVLLFEGINAKVKNVEIEFQSRQHIDQVLLFYSNDNLPLVCEKTMHSAFPDESNAVTFTINDWVTDIRIDPGEDSELQLDDCSVVLNKRKFSMSVSRIVAVILISITSGFLFSIQRMPDYHISSEPNTDTH